MNSAEMPYGMAGRPMPAGNDPERLLPRQVGGFARPAIKPGGPGMPIYAEYRQGAATIFMELGIGADANDARAILDTARDEAGAAGPGSLFAEGPDGACVRTVDAGGAFLAWTRGRYFFSAHARGGENDLAAFAQVFPY
jgi:hypothetical protein